MQFNRGVVLIDSSGTDVGRRNWKGKAAARDAVHANRRRIRGARGRRLLRQRGELLGASVIKCW